MIVLIPAYQPDARLIRLVMELHQANPLVRVLIVDDGSGPAYSLYFEATQAAGARVITCDVNRGKGHALKVGFAAIQVDFPEELTVVTADADGQHSAADILRVGHACERNRRMTLGVRHFVGAVPLRSKIGNRMTALLFAGATGWDVEDTQTGLRAFPREYLEWLLTVPGQRYEYELSVLLGASSRGVPVEQVPIDTIYEDNNATSHFHPLRDSARIYAPLLKFSAASFTSFIVDYIAVIILHTLLGGLLIPVISARILSGGVNFLLNRRVFDSSTAPLGRSFLRYVGLSCALVACSYGLLWVTTSAGIPIWCAKPLIDISLYVVSYKIQKAFVFSHARDDEATGIEDSSTSLNSSRSLAEGELPAMCAVPRLMSEEDPAYSSALTPLRYAAHMHKPALDHAEDHRVSYRALSTHSF